MNSKLTKEEVLHVAELARIKIYDILIAPWDSKTHLREDVPGDMLDPKQVIANAPRHSGNFIEVPVVISEEE